MWPVLRKTDSRGRVGVPDTRVRTLVFRLSRAATFHATAIAPPTAPLLGAGLADLPPDSLVGVLDPLRLVGIGAPVRADRGGRLANQLLVDALDGDHRVALDLRGDPLRQDVLHRVAEAEREDEGVALHLRPVADAA